MASTGLGVTIGNHSLRAVKVRRKGEGFVVQRVFADRLNDETRPVAGRALSARGFRGVPATLGLTGRDVIIRYSQVPPVPEWRLRTLMKFEVDEVSSQSGGDVSADYRKLNLPDPEATRSDDAILVALARNAYLDRLIRSIGAGGVRPAGACPNSIALFNAFAINATYAEDETSLLVNIGAEDLDIAIQQGGELLFARNATPGGKAFTDAIQNAFSTSAGKAEQMKLAKADVTPRGRATYPDSTAEKVANAIMGVAGQMASLIQSTLMIARAQTKLHELKVDRVFLSGGGASLKGLDLYLEQAMGVPVERLDPFALSDLSQLTDEERTMIERAPHEFAVAMGLAQSTLSPAAFPLTVLPAALKRRQEFMTKGIWSAAAAVAALAILALLYKFRTDDSAAALQVDGRIRRDITTARNLDDKLRKGWATSQEEAVKHLLLAEVGTPGAILGRTLYVLEENLQEAKDVYLQTVQLRVNESSNEFPYFKPRRNDLATGYEEVMRRRYFRRDAVVRVVGRISATTRPDAVYQEFVTNCQQNAQGLIVETITGFQRGRRRDEDGSFELEFRPGIRLELVSDDGTEVGEVMLRDAYLDDADEPTSIGGRRADGVFVTVPQDALRRDDWRDLVRELPARDDETEGG